MKRSDGDSRKAGLMSAAKRTVRWGSVVGFVVFALFAFVAQLRTGDDWDTFFVGMALFGFGYYFLAAFLFEKEIWIGAISIPLSSEYMIVRILYAAIGLMILIFGASEML